MINNMQNFLQRTTDEDVHIADRTFADLMTYVSDKDIDDAREENIPNFLQFHRKWCQKEASFVLGKRGLRFEKWKKQFLWLAFDAVAIMIWARCYRKHVAIVFNYKCWTTHKTDDSSKCDVFLAFRGENCFEPTRVMTTEEYTSHQDAIARVQAHMDELALWENMQKLHKRRAKDYKRNVDRIESSDKDQESGYFTTEDEELDLEGAMETDDSPAATNSTVPIGIDLRKHKTSENNNMQKPDSVGKKQKQTTDNSMQKTDKKDNIEPNVQETDVSNNSNEKKDKSGDDSDESSAPEGDSDTGSSGEESDHAASNMQKRSRLPKPQGARVLFKTYHCLSQGCPVTKQSKKAVLKHIKDAHKDYHFKCNKCPQSFASWIGHYKHHKRHIGKAYICEECGKAFQFPGELDEHECLHTGEDLVKCSFCDKEYPSKRARNLHEKSHTDSTEYDCTFQDKDGVICGQVCVSANHLKQHFRGMHRRMGESLR